jgi:hypothetical protein
MRRILILPSVLAQGDGNKGLTRGKQKPSKICLPGRRNRIPPQHAVILFRHRVLLRM